MFSTVPLEGGHMHGLIFMTWEKYLTERFGLPFLHVYCEKIGERTADVPLANRLYDDAQLIAGRVT